MVYSRISAVLFFLSALSIIWIIKGSGSIDSPYFFWIGFVGIGFLAFVFSILSVFLDKKRKDHKMNPVKGLMRYVGMFTIFVGFVFNIFHLPFNRILLLAGLLITAASIFMKSKEVRNTESDLLDDDLI